MLEKKEKKLKRHKRIRGKISGTKSRPRLCVFRSNKHIYAQLIDDKKGHVLLSASDLEIKNKKVKKIDRARDVGRLIAKKAKEKNIQKVIFDRSGYKYHGRIKSLAEGAREEGLIF